MKRSSDVGWLADAIPMASDDVALIEQSGDGLLMVGPVGERLTAARDFFAVFETDDEWRLVTGGPDAGHRADHQRPRGRCPRRVRGCRWRVEAVDDRGKVLTVVPHRSGKLPLFDPVSGEAVHRRLSEEMRHVLAADDVPSFIDPAARGFLAEGRAAFRRLGLDRRCAIPSGRDTLLATWAGTAVNDVLAILIRSAGLDVQADDVALTVADSTPEELRALIGSLSKVPSVEDLSAFVENLRGAKYDAFVDEALLRRLWANRARPARVEAIAVLEALAW